MTLNELDQSADFYRRLCNEWLEVPGLTIPERGMILQLHDASIRGLEAFDELRGLLATNNGLLFNTLVSAVTKARAHGVGRRA